MGKNKVGSAVNGGEEGVHDREDRREKVKIALMPPGQVRLSAPRTDSRIN
jgi:hypothetical protein